MIAINHISMGVSLLALIAVVLGWLLVRDGRSGAEGRLLLLLLYLFGSIASVFASALSIAIGSFAVYSIVMGLAIFALIYIHYRVRQSWEE